MRGVFTYSVAVLLTFTYLLSYIGFGVHTCTCNGTTQVILLFNNLSCETIHAHIHLKGSHEHHHGDGCCDEDGGTEQTAPHECTSHHSDGCCHTDIMVLTDAQDDSRQTNLVQVRFRTIGTPSDAADLRPNELPSGINDIIHCHFYGQGLPDTGGPALAMLSVRRI